MKMSIMESSLLTILRLSKYENTIEFYFLGIVKSTQGRNHLGPNPSFFRFVKHVSMGLIEYELTKHLLPSSSLLKNKELLSYLGGGEFEKWVKPFIIMVA
jgi:hypothetical protein